VVTRAEKSSSAPVLPEHGTPSPSVTGIPSRYEEIASSLPPSDLSLYEAPQPGLREEARYHLPSTSDQLPNQQDVFLPLSMQQPQNASQERPFTSSTHQVAPTMASYAMQQMEVMQQPLPQHAEDFGDVQDTAFMHVADEGSTWGASVGFGLEEWARFLDVVVQGPGAPIGDMDTATL